MRKTKAIDIDGKVYVVRELTPFEIDKLFDQVNHQGTSSMVDAMLDVHDLDTVLLGAMLDLKAQEVERLIGERVPSEYQPIIAAAREINPDFFEMARRRRILAGQMDAINKILALASESPSPASLPLDTTMPGTMA